MPLFDGAELLTIIAKANALALNDYEASVVQDRTGRSPASLAEDLEAVVVTRGAEGATLYLKGQTIAIDPVTATAVTDPTGCGDAHRAGLLHGLTHGWSWEKACMLGNVMGALKIASRGPQNHSPSLAEISKLMQSTYGIGL